MNSFPPVCGIVAEYNPFHSGHMFHIRRTRESLGGDAVIVCAMSGNFVQRGDFAVLDKYARAETAVRGGADLVLGDGIAGKDVPAVALSQAAPPKALRAARSRCCTASAAGICPSARKPRIFRWFSRPPRR